MLSVKDQSLSRPRGSTMRWVTILFMSVFLVGSGVGRGSHVAAEAECGLVREPQRLVPSAARSRGTRDPRTDCAPLCARLSSPPPLILGGFTGSGSSGFALRQARPGGVARVVSATPPSVTHHSSRTLCALAGSVLGRIGPPQFSHSSRSVIFAGLSPSRYRKSGYLPTMCCSGGASWRRRGRCDNTQAGVYALMIHGGYPTL